MSKEELESRKLEAELLKASRKLSMQSEGLDRKKHWGTGTKIKDYEDAVKESVDLEPLEQALNQFSQEAVVSENLFDRLANSIDFTDLFSGELVERLQGIVAETFQKGSSRVVTTEGETISVGFGKEPERLIEQLQSQEIYLKNLGEDARETVRDTITKGAEEGRSIGEMRDEIVESVEDMTEHRAETIARSEVIEASNRGTEAALDEAGVEKAVVHAEVDNMICESGTFSWNGYSSCEEWHQEVFNREDLPRIPKDSHPNCRCAILAKVD